MKAAFFCVLLLLSCRSPAPPFAWHPGPVSDAMAVARSENRALLVVVGASWCPTCHQLEREVFVRAADRLPAGLLGVRVDFDSAEGSAVAQRQRILSLPTSVVLGPGGGERGRVEGFESVGGYVEALSLAVSGGRDAIAEARALVASRPDDAKALEAAGEVLLAAGLEDEGLGLLERARKRDAGDLSGAWREATRVMGRYWMRVRGEPERALPFFREGAAGSRDPGAAWGFRYWVAMTLAAASRPSEAAELLDRWVAESPGAAEPLAIQAEYLLMRREREAAALGLAREAAKRAPRDDWNHYLVAALCERTGDKAGATEAIRQALALAPEQAIYEDLAARVRIPAKE